VTNSLTAIANEEGTDKGTIGPVEGWHAHNYTDVYDAYLHPLRHEPITMLEIGLGVRGPNWRARIARGRNAQGGASMRMWYRYFTQARILGLDANPAGFLDNDRIQTGVVDQGDPEALRAFLADRQIDRLDVVIDDGSHRPDHQQISFTTLFPYVAPGGLYFIEDLDDNGLGDGRTGRSASEDVLSTRRVLQGFARDGVFPAPNALNGEGLVDSIETVSFHCPRVVITSGALPPQSFLRKRGADAGQMRTRFASGQEELCVIRKKAVRGSAVDRGE
jgi:hypothetical protein